MEQIILVVHVLTALAIVALILLQQGKGAEAGASFGSGASQTVFGSQGGGNFFTRATAVFATVFFVTSFGLAVLSKQKASVAVDDGIPTLIEQSAEVPVAAEDESEIPFVADDVADDAASDVSDIPVVEE